MKTAKIFLGTFAFIVALALPVHATIQYPYEYHYDSTAGGCSGELFLDASSSQSGALADIGPTSYVDLDGQQIFLSNLSLATPNGDLTWNVGGVTTPISLFITVFLQRVPANNAQGFVDELEFASERVTLGTPGSGVAGGAVSMYIYDDLSQVGGGLYSGAGPDSAGEWVGDAPVPEPSQLIVGAMLCSALGTSYLKKKSGPA